MSLPKRSAYYMNYYSYSKPFPNPVRSKCREIEMLSQSETGPVSQRESRLFSERPKSSYRISELNGEIINRESQYVDCILDNSFWRTKFVELRCNFGQIDCTDCCSLFYRLRHFFTARFCM